MKNNIVSTPRLAVLFNSLNVLWRPSTIVALLSLFLLGVVAFTRHYDARDFVHLGTIWANHDKAGTWGYDGQFYYQIAQNPLQAGQYMDNAPFRYQHILYPLLAGMLSLGQSGLIPFMLLFVNVLAVALSVELLASLLLKADFSPWFSLALGLYFGQTTGILFDTAEPFTYFLVCLGIWLYVEKNRFWPAALTMGLATLSREIALLFPLGYACVFSLWRKWNLLTKCALAGIAPLCLWLLVLWLIFGQTGVTFTQPFEHIPFAGIFYHAHAPKKFYLLLLMMFLPTLAGWALVCSDFIRKIVTGTGPLRQRFSPLYLILVANLLMITLLSHHSYDELISCGRIATGLVLIVLLYAISTRNRWALWGAQFYTCTFAIFVLGTLLHWPSFIA